MIDREDCKDLLRSHKLRITNCRLDVIGHFLEEKRTLFQSELERKFPRYDRVTLYRTLLSFLEAGVAHRIPNETGVASYGLCHDTCAPNQHNHNHIHFKCNNCGKIECLDEEAVPQVSLPAGYQVETVNLIVDGICNDCL
ncbi:MAG: transcriptional repressor [Bacteroidota bacterium]